MADLLYNCLIDRGRFLWEAFTRLTSKKLSLPLRKHLNTNPGQARKLRQYAEADGDAPLRFAEKMVGKWKNGVSFNGLGKAWYSRHGTDFQNLGLDKAGVEEMIHGTNGIIKTGRKGVQRYVDPETGAKDQFIFAKEVDFPTGDRKWVYVVADETGQVFNAYPVSAKYLLNPDPSSPRKWILELF